MTGKKRKTPAAIRDLLRDLEDFDRDPASAGYDLRLDLADIVLRHLDGKRWTQKKLADAAGMKSPFITRITHAAQNCTFDVAGRLLFALGVKARLEEAPPDFTRVRSATTPPSQRTRSPMQSRRRPQAKPTKVRRPPQRPS